MTKLKQLSSKYLCTSLLALMLAALSTLALCGCGTVQTASVGADLPVPTVDSSLLAQPKGLATYSLAAPPLAASNTAATTVKLSDVAAQHTQEAAYTQTLEVMVKGWQQWYADLKKYYNLTSMQQ